MECLPLPGAAGAARLSMNDASWTVDQALQRGPSGARRYSSWAARAAGQWDLGDSEGQQGTANLEVIGRLAAHLGRETAGVRFHTAEVTGW